jgi:tRNA(Ile2) C34 agmatinyltransferase TiaS
MASKGNVAQFRCSVCGKTFLTQQEADEHTKRDHVEQKKPAGVS